MQNRGDESLPARSLVYLSVDVGETTGLAAYELWLDPKLRCDTFTEPSKVVEIIRLLRPNLIITERFPEYRSLSYEVEKLYMYLTRFSVLISPGSWKPFMKNRKRDFSQAKTRHEKDAVNMLRYFLLSQGGKDIL